MAVEEQRLLGSNVIATLLNFIIEAEEGARATLQRNHEGFSIQVLQAVQRPGEGSLKLEDLQTWQKRLTSTGRGTPRTP